MTIPRSLQALADLLERLASGAGADRIPGPPPGSHARGSSDTEGHPNAPAGAPEVKRDRCLDTAPTSGGLELEVVHGARALVPHVVNGYSTFNLLQLHPAFPGQPPLAGERPATISFPRGAFLTKVLASGNSETTCARESLRC